MAFNQGFPATYQPMYYAPQYQPMQQTAPQIFPQSKGTGETRSSRR